MGVLLSEPISQDESNNRYPILFAGGFFILSILYFILFQSPKFFKWLTSARSGQGWRLNDPKTLEKALILGLDVPVPQPQVPPPHVQSISTLSAHLRTTYNSLLLPSVPYFDLTVGQCLVLGLYAAGCFAGLMYDTFPGNSVINDPKRAGHMILANLLLTLLLATKNSLLTALIGKGYERLHFLHRFAGLCVIVCAGVHAILMNTGVNKTLQMGNPMRTYGLIAISFLALIFLSVMPPGRRYYYQLFLSCHFIGIVGFIIAVCYHQPQIAPIHVMIGLPPIVIDYLWRFWTSRTRFARISRARGDFTRIQISSLSDGWRSGQHVFVRVLESGISFQSHPITIANAPCSILPGRGLDLHVHVAGDWSETLRDKAQKRIGDTTSQMSQAISFDTIRGRDPLEDRARIVKVRLHGPFGGFSYRDPSVFEGVLIIVGGSGVTFGLSVLEDLVGGSLQDPPTTATRLMAFVWTVQNPDTILTFGSQIDHLIDISRQTIFSSVRLHVTGGSSTNPERIKNAFRNGDIVGGRPNTQELIEDFVSALIGPSVVPSSHGGIMVCCCGPSTLITQVRSSVRKVKRARAVKAGGIVLHSEHYNL